jgi:hypothetical protein
MSFSALEFLRESDPARSLVAVDENARRAQREAIFSHDVPRRSDSVCRPTTRLLRAGVAVAAALVFGVGIAWASGALSPLSVFENNAQNNENPAGSVWGQSVMSGTVRQISSVEIPEVGAVSFWFGETKEHGWCGALRLPDGNWLGTGSSSLDGGGTVPGCYPTRSAINAAATKPVLVINGFDYQEDDVDARPLGGSYWRIRFGYAGGTGAVKVVDRASGAEAPVRDGLFQLAVSDPDPAGRTPFHLVAYDASGALVGDACPNCP